VTADARRLAWGGAAFGFAAAIKIWALVPLGVVALLLAATTRRSRSRSRRRRRRPRPVAALAGGAALGLGLPLLPFVALAPGAVVRGVVISQEVRNADGHGSPLGRLADLTGLQLLPVRADRGLALLVIAVVVTAGYAAVYLAARRRPAALVAHAVDAHGPDAHGPDAHGPDTYFLDTYALAGAVAVTVMFLWPRLYYSHYGAFDGPFLALAVALPAGRLVTGRLVTGRLVTGGSAARREAAASRWTAAALTALVLVLGAAVALQFRAESALRGVPAPAAADRLIPPGACVLTNDPAYTVAVDRFFSDAPGCPAMVDSFGTLIALTSGRSRDTAAPVLRPVVELWRADLGRAGYVWLTGDTAGQIPWTGPLDAYFRGHFQLIGLTQPHWSSRLIPRPGLYVRR
jgi:hypothetical protein